MLAVSIYPKTSHFFPDFDLTKEITVPIAVNNRHVHLSKEDARTIFGESHEFSLDPSPERFLWPGHSLWKEKVTLSGPGGTIQRVSLLGPLGDKTSIEMSCGDGYHLGLNDEDVKAKKFLPGLTLTGPKGSVFVSTDSPINGRWLLLSQSRADKNGLKDGTSVDVRVGSGSDWETTFLKVKVIISSWTDQDCWALYLDPDAAGAASAKAGDTAQVILF